MKRLQFIKTMSGFLSGGWMLSKVLYNRHLTEKKEYTLYKGWVAGCAYYNAAEVLGELAPGQPLILHREPKNKFDKNAIEIYAGTAKLGYIAKTDNPVLAALMDNGEPIFAEVARVNPEGRVWRQIKVKITKT